MGNFNLIPIGLPGLVMIEPQVFTDERGYFMETYSESAFAEAGLAVCFVQDNQSYSRQGVLRGMHFQRCHPQAKLVRVLLGEIFDATIDLRPNSRTYGQWFGMVLSAKNRRQLFIPEGFAHGFLVLSDEAEIFYKASTLYRPDDEGGIRWDDPQIRIQWPVDQVQQLTLSEKDRSWPSLQSAFVG